MLRRQLFFSTLAALPMLGWPWVHAASRVARVRPGAQALATLEGLFADPAHARAVGRCYLARHPGRAHAAELLSDTGLSDLLNRRHLPPARVRRAIIEANHRDYLNGQTVLLDGWIVPRAEASVCGLLALWG